MEPWQSHFDIEGYFDFVNHDRLIVEMMDSVRIPKVDLFVLMGSEGR